MYRPSQSLVRCPCCCWSFEDDDCGDTAADDGGDDDDVRSEYDTIGGFVVSVEEVVAAKSSTAGLLSGWETFVSDTGSDEAEKVSGKVVVCFSDDDDDDAGGGWAYKTSTRPLS